MGSGLLSPCCAPAAPQQRSRASSHPGGLQQPLTHRPGSSPAPEWSCSPSPTVLDVLPLRGDSCSPSLEPAGAPCGAGARTCGFPDSAEGSRPVTTATGLLPQGPRNLAGPQPSPACWGRALEAAAAAMMGVGSPHQPPVGRGFLRAVPCQRAVLYGHRVPLCSLVCSAAARARCCPLPRLAQAAVAAQALPHTPGPGGRCPQAGLGWGPYGGRLGQSLCVLMVTEGFQGLGRPRAPRRFAVWDATGFWGTPLPPARLLGREPDPRSGLARSRGGDAQNSSAIRFRGPRPSAPPAPGG